MKDLIDLLYQLAVADPQYCCIGTGVFRNQFLIRVFPWKWINLSSVQSTWVYDQTALLLLERSLQHKIQEKGYKWALHSHKKGCKAFIPGLDIYGIHSEPAVALLMCYLRILKKAWNVSCEYPGEFRKPRFLNCKDYQEAEQWRRWLLRTEPESNPKIEMVENKNELAAIV